MSVSSPVGHTISASLGHLKAPTLIVIIDTEEEFDWSKPHSRAETGVAHVASLWRTQRIFERYGVRVVYVVDYPIASQEGAYKPLKEWQDDGLCVIGAHLHPWVNPPFEEENTLRNTYPGNLPPALEFAKLARLVETIQTNFGRRPTIYRAGRYGVGAATGNALEQLGFVVDSSVVPHTDLRYDFGPDFRGLSGDPFWFGPQHSVLELPLTVGWYGLLRSYGRALQPTLLSQRSVRLRLPGVFARLGLFERIRLTPEGINFAELKRLTDTMLAAGERLFILSYHSPSAAPGHTPYVRDDAECRGFLDLIERYCDYFFGSCGGTASTPEAVYAAMVGKSPAAAACSAR